MPNGISTEITRARWLIVATTAVMAAVVWSGIDPHDRATWFMEVLPVLLIVPFLWVSYRSYPLTTLLYCCIFVHALILILGGAYTYARVPLGFELQEWFGLQRNPYDKIGHLAQGFVPALAAREFLIRGGYVIGRKMLVFVVISIVLAISASYELIEWAAALAMGQGAEDFLGTQGDVWDTQSDMFCALIGAIAALLCFSHLHDRQLARL